MRREGLAGLNTNRIAGRAGISVGTPYGQFPDKTAVLVALARRILQEDQAALLAAVESEPDGDPVRALLARHRADRELRRAVMSVPLGEGLGDEHSARVETFILVLAKRRNLARLGALRLFVATRAALGVARAPVEENKATAFTDTALEDEVVRLVPGYLSPAAAPSPA